MPLGVLTYPPSLHQLFELYLPTPPSDNQLMGPYLPTPRSEDQLMVLYNLPPILLCVQNIN